MGSFLPCPAFPFCGVQPEVISGIIWWRGVEKGSKETGMAAEFSPSEIFAAPSDAGMGVGFWDCPPQKNPGIQIMSRGLI